MANRYTRILDAGWKHIQFTVLGSVAVRSGRKATLELDPGVRRHLPTSSLSHESVVLPMLVYVFREDI